MGRAGRRNRSLRREAYEAIKGRIVSLQFRPGERLEVGLRTRASLREHLKQVQADHKAILRHLARGDPDALEKAVVGHVQLFRERVQGLL